jgi:4-azaleucine resistance transporter AzlC
LTVTPSWGTLRKRLDSHGVVSSFLKGQGMENSLKTSARWRQGLGAAWPICLGYLPLGIALGVLARQAGIDPLGIALMSLLVFAGSAQFIAVAMLAAGASVGAIVLATLVVNIRHLLMSSALAVHLRGVGPSFLALFAYGITDESFAVNMTRFRSGDWDRWRALIVNQSANAAWVLSSVAGAFLGELIPAGAFGIDYALIGMFLCLLVFQLRGAFHVFTALISGGLSVACYLAVPGDSYVVVAAVGAASAGFLLQRCKRRGRR